MIKHWGLILLAVVCVCTIATIYVPLSSITKEPTKVAPCKKAHCEDHTETDVYNPERVEILRRRARKLQERCEQMYGKQNRTETSRNPRKMLVSDKFKLVFCCIPKVASSNVRRTFLVMNGIVNKFNPVDVTAAEVNGNSKYQINLGSFSKDGVRYKLRNYKKVIFVRNPFERLISAFNNKFKFGKDPFFLNNVTKHIIQTVRQDKDHAGNHTVTFANFIQYIIIEYGKHKAFNQHWDTYTRMCDPCRIQYDFVGKYETIDEDMDAVLKWIGADSIQFPTRKELRQYKTTPSADLLEAYYKDIPDAHITRLKDIYANDIMLFGLKFPKAV